jgi:hypothetical protein
VGGSASYTVTVKEQVEEFPEGSLVVAVTVVVPIEKVDPEGVEHVVAVPQLSVAVATYVTVSAEHAPGLLLATMFAGQVTVGFVVSGAINAPLDTNGPSASSSKISRRQFAPVRPLKVSINTTVYSRVATVLKYREPTCEGKYWIFTNTHSVAGAVKV